MDPTYGTGFKNNTEQRKKVGGDGQNPNDRSLQSFVQPTFQQQSGSVGYQEKRKIVGSDQRSQQLPVDPQQLMNYQPPGFTSGQPPVNLYNQPRTSVQQEQRKRVGGEDRRGNPSTLETRKKVGSEDYQN